MQERMDAAGAVDAKNAPTAPWKTAQHAVSHSAPHASSSIRFTHEIPDSPDTDSIGVLSQAAVSILFSVLAGLIGAFGLKKL
jgi:hypothetical protein